jgi:acetoin utilization deacetylase AcuC-like enzyme
MGFCFLNAVAVAARDAQRRHGVGRVLVADFDVHHGNGTQETFWEDGSVAYLSVHRYPFYPGTGGRDETGSGAGLGLTVNVPLPAGAGDDAYAGGFEAALEGLLRLFRPDLVLVSAGFDAHHRDPLGGMRVSAEGFARLTRALADAADAFAGGRLVSVLEGGYDPSGTAEGALAHARVLAGDREPSH